MKAGRILAARAEMLKCVIYEKYTCIIQAIVAAWKATANNESKNSAVEVRMYGKLNMALSKISKISISKWKYLYKI